MPRPTFLITTLGLLTVLAPTSALALCGDVSGDQKITTSDALAVLKTAVGQPTNLMCTLPGGDCAGDLRYLLGQWVFQPEFEELFRDDYELFAVDDQQCAIAGEDLNDQSIVVAIEGGNTGYDYALLDPGGTYCDFFLFDRTGPDTVEGVDILLDVDDDSYCLAPNDDSLVGPMIGDRLPEEAVASLRQTGLGTVQRGDSKNSLANLTSRRLGQVEPQLEETFHRLMFRRR